ERPHRARRCPPPGRCIHRRRCDPHRLFDRLGGAWLDDRLRPANHPALSDVSRCTAHQLGKMPTFRGGRQMPRGSNPEVIVVGAGVVGCSLAFHLTRAGARVMVFDKGDICAGMSARSGALIRMHYTFAPEVELAWKSFGYFSNWPEIV